jgi:hypothetical protein
LELLPLEAAQPELDGVASGSRPLALATLLVALWLARMKALSKDPLDFYLCWKPPAAAEEDEDAVATVEISPRNKIKLNIHCA